MDINNCSIGFLDAPDITGVLVFITVRYGHKKENSVPYYKRKDLKFKDYRK